MTDFSDACFGCGGHLRANVYAGNLCPKCEVRHQRGEMTAFGNLTGPQTRTIPTLDARALIEAAATAKVEQELLATLETQKRRAA